jgi:hypothetical protein
VGCTRGHRHTIISLPTRREGLAPQAGIGTSRPSRPVRCGVILVS